jgi:DNA-binding MarR family transcriptional regulator
MSLEEEIRQTNFTNSFEKAAINILVTASWLHNHNSNRLKPYLITPEQYNVLRILKGSHPKALKLADITARMIDKNSNATRLVEKLKQKGLVDRTICEGNRRQVDISIKDEGLLKLDAIEKDQDNFLNLLQHITADEAEELNRILDKLRR